MKIARAFLLFVIGTLSASVAGWLYLGLLFLRYHMPVPLPTDFNDAMVIVIFIGLPAITGGVTATFFPVWQRVTKLRSSTVCAVTLALSASILPVIGQVALLKAEHAIISVLNIDIVLWFVCAAVGGLFFHALRVLTGDTKRAVAHVLGQLRHTISFEPAAVQRVSGIAMVFDIQGFAAFFNQQWASEYVTRYLDLVFSAVAVELFGGKRFWGNEENVSSFHRPVHQKFLGDGMLLIWTRPAGKGDFPPGFVSELTKRLWSFEEQFPLVSEACKGPIPYSFELPQQVRFGVAAGEIYELTRRDSRATEYMGFCINLASRLQGYCRDAGSIISASVKVPKETEKELDLVRVVATKIQGFASEHVSVRRQRIAAVDDEQRNSLFAAP